MSMEITIWLKFHQGHHLLGYDELCDLVIEIDPTYMAAYYNRAEAYSVLSMKMLYKPL